MSGVSVPGWVFRGNRVVCVREIDPGAVSDPCGLMTYPIVDSIYTIRGSKMAYVPDYNEVLFGIWLVEIVNPTAEMGTGAGEEMAFDVRSFRPLVELRVDEEQEVPESV